MNIPVRKIVISVSIILGAILLTAKTDREYISLEPTEGISSGIVLEETKEYTQRFTANRDSITRVGIHLRPITPHIPDVKIPITLTNSQGETVSAAIPAIFIDKQSATEVRFNPPLETTPGNPVVMTIGVPSELSGKVRIQTRVQDDTFDATYATFLIDNEIQENPLAYRVSYQHRPAIIIQIGLLLVLGGMYHVTRHAKKTILLIFALPAIYITPALIANQLPITFYIILLTALSVSFFIFRKNTSQIAALTGASVFSFTSWWPLQRYLWLTNDKWDDIPATPANPRDIWLDSNQVPDALKVIGVENWAHFGSYIGIIAATLAAIWLIVFVQAYFLRNPRRSAVNMQMIVLVIAVVVSSLIVLASPITSFFTWLPFPPQHLSIIVTFGLACFAAKGLDLLKNYLGSQYKLTAIIVHVITFLILVDLFQVSIKIFELRL